VNPLRLGAGIALGYATCGEVGFEGRSDYAAIGAVTNLASRLADEATGGQILIEQRLYAEVEDDVDAVDYEGAGDVLPAPGVLEALAAADAILIAPSNPYLSIGPILVVAAIRGSLQARAVRAVAVSPLVGGDAVTGPLGRMLTRMAGGSTPEHVAARYEGVIDALVIDGVDAPATAGVELVVTSTLMSDAESERRLADAVLEAACA